MLFSKNEIEEIFKIVSPITISVRDVDGSNSPPPLKMCKKKKRIRLHLFGFLFSSSYGRGVI